MTNNRKKCIEEIVRMYNLFYINDKGKDLYYWHFGTLKLKKSLLKDRKRFLKYWYLDENDGKYKMKYGKW